MGKRSRMRKRKLREQTRRAALWTWGGGEVYGYTNFPDRGQRWPTGEPQSLVKLHSIQISKEWDGKLPWFPARYKYLGSEVISSRLVYHRGAIMTIHEVSHQFEVLDGKEETPGTEIFPVINWDTGLRPTLSIQSVPGG